MELTGFEPVIPHCERVCAQATGLEYRQNRLVRIGFPVRRRASSFRVAVGSRVLAIWSHQPTELWHGQGRPRSQLREILWSEVQKVEKLLSLVDLGRPICLAQRLKRQDFPLHEIV